LLPLSKEEPNQGDRLAMFILLVFLFKLLLKYNYMKEVNLGVNHCFYILMLIIFVIVTLGSYNGSANITLKSKDLVFDNFTKFNLSIDNIIKSDMSKAEKIKLDLLSNEELSEDFRYINLFR